MRDRASRTWRSRLAPEPTRCASSASPRFASARTPTRRRAPNRSLSARTCLTSFNPESPIATSRCAGDWPRAWTTQSENEEVPWPSPTAAARAPQVPASDPRARRSPGRAARRGRAAVGERFDRESQAGEHERQRPAVDPADERQLQAVDLADERQPGDERQPEARDEPVDQWQQRARQGHRRCDDHRSPGPRARPRRRRCGGCGRRSSGQAPARAQAPQGPRRARAQAEGRWPALRRAGSHAGRQGIANAGKRAAKTSQQLRSCPTTSSRSARPPRRWATRSPGPLALGPQPLGRGEVEGQALGVLVGIAGDDDPVVARGAFERDVAVAHVALDRLGVALQRIAPPSASGVDVAQDRAGRRRVAGRREGVHVASRRDRGRLVSGSTTPASGVAAR